MDRIIITPLLTLSSFYKNVEYDLQEIQELKELFLSDDEKRRYDKMKGNTSKQAFFALATIIDLTSLKKR